MKPPRLSKHFKLTAHGAAKYTDIKAGNNNVTAYFKCCIIKQDVESLSYGLQIDIEYHVQTCLSKN